MVMLNANTRNCFCLCIILLLGMVSFNALAKGQTTQVSVATSGVQGDRFSYQPHLSADGRYVAFTSSASNLVAGDTNGWHDVFVHDRLTKQITRVSVATGGGQGNSQSWDGYPPAISADGRYVAFGSYASNLVAGDTNGWADVFVHDRLTKQTTRVSVATDGGQGDSDSVNSSISADGRYVAFVSNAKNLVVGDARFREDIFVHDRLTKQTTLVSKATNGTQANERSIWPRLSADGRYVAFTSNASNLVGGDTNSKDDIFVHDRQTKQTTRVSVATNGTQANESSFGTGLSADGRYVTFGSYASNLVSGDTNNKADTFIYDRQAKQTSRVSVATDGRQATGHSFSFDISADGRYVSFESIANNLVAGDTNAKSDIFVHDRLTKQTTRANVATDGSQTNFGSHSPILSADGRYVSFASIANNLAAGDTNNKDDVFIRDRNFFPGNPTDLKITAASKPASLAVNGLGSYTYNLANVGLFPVFPQLTHLVSNGLVTGFASSQGASCHRSPNTGVCGCHRYALISLCNLDVLQPGTSMTLTLTVKAVRNALHQQLTLSSYGRDDPVKANNYLSLDTPVTP
jgi:WD40-like Beta Propeller Repeat